MLQHKKTWIITTIFFLAIVVFVSCMDDSENAAPDIRGEAYAGAQTCVSCHKDIHDHFLLSAHANTSSEASAKTIAGSFIAPNNLFAYSDADTVKMEEKDGGFYQTEYMNGQAKQSQRFDIAIGSGRKAQTYLYHKGDKIFELPVSYFKAIGSWANSPGLPLDHPSFERSIPSGCFGCHGSAANVTLEKTGSLEVSENFLPGQLLLGIDCERCHGPSKQHVEYQLAHPDDTTAKFITNIKSLTRAQQMDMCAVCHSGVKKAFRPVFTFKPGNRLDDFYYPQAVSPAAGKLDVHDTQAQSIMASQCYIKSTTLTCISCHDTHKNEREDLALFSQRCMNCHMESNHNFCTIKDVPAATLTANCIDCHMPAKPSKVIQMLANTSGKQNLHADYVRSHIVAVYPEETKKILALWKAGNGK